MEEITVIPTGQRGEEEVEEHLSFYFSWNPLIHFQFFFYLDQRKDCHCINNRADILSHF